MRDWGAPEISRIIVGLPIPRRNVRTRKSDSGLYDAYRRAWSTRLASGDTRDDLLLGSFLDALGPDHEVLVDGSEQNRIWLEAWRRATPPTRLMRFLVSYGAESLSEHLREIRKIVRHGWPDWMDLPPDVSRLSRERFGSDAENVKQIELAFRGRTCGLATLDRCVELDLERNKKGFFKVPVWLDIGQGDHANVMLGTDAIGATTVNRSLTAAVGKPKRRGARKVPDGTLQVRNEADGRYAFRKLKVYFPRS